MKKSIYYTLLPYIERISFRIGAPYLMYKPNPDGVYKKGNDLFEGYAMDLMHEICKPDNLNCTYTFSLVPDNQYGRYDPEKKEWNGLIRELLELVRWFVDLDVEKKLTIDRIMKSVKIKDVDNGRRETKASKC